MSFLPPRRCFILLSLGIDVGATTLAVNQPMNNNAQYLLFSREYPCFGAMQTILIQEASKVQSSWGSPTKIFSDTFLNLRVEPQKICA